MTLQCLQLACSSSLVLLGSLRSTHCRWHRRAERKPLPCSIPSLLCHYYQRWQLFDLTQLLLRILRTTGYFLQNLIKTRKLNNVLKQPVSKKMRKSLLFLFNTLIQPISTFLKNLSMIFKNYNLTKYDSTHLWSQHVGGRGKQVFLSSMPAYLHRKFQTNKDLRSRSQKKTNNKNRTQYKS